MKKIRLLFDMDGTIADLYGEENWLEDIKAGRTTPYENAKPMGIEKIVNDIKKLKEKMGERLEINVCTWLAKGSTEKYDMKVINAKYDWLFENGFFQILDKFIPYKYGTNKSKATTNNCINILFDDNNEVRKEFIENKNNMAFAETEILQVLKLIESM